MVKDVNGQVLDNNEIIWRYMDFASFYSLLLTKGLFFKRLDKYSDELEGTLPDETKEELLTHRLTFPYTSSSEAEDWLNKYSVSVESRKVGTLSNSWISSKVENYGMWKIYLRGSAEGVAIQTTVGNLRQALEMNTTEIFLGKVIYDPISVAYIDQHVVSTHKRNAYSYENELRALIFNQFKVKNLPNGDHQIIPIYELGNSFNVDVDILIDKVYISPFTSGWFADVVKSSLQSFIPSFDVGKLITSRIKDK